MVFPIRVNPDNDESATVKDAAGRYGVSDNHLAKVAQKPVPGQVVSSLCRRGDGLKLAMDPEEVNIGI